MSRIASRAWMILPVLIAMAGCGPSAPGGGEGDAADAAIDPSETATLRGAVWAPGNAPGMAPAGHEIPIFSALVYLTVQPPTPIPQETYCESCVDDHGGALTDHRGNFTLTGVVPGTYWLVVQKGQFRVEHQITIPGPGEIQLDATQTTLPSEHDPQNGQWVPRIALASGSYDAMQAILGKMAIGQVDETGEFLPGSAAGNFDVYSNGGAIDGVAIGSLTELVTDLDRMMQYHIIFFPCAGDANTSALRDQQTLRNLRDYVTAGGKLYVADFSGEWVDNVFPAQITLSGAGIDTPASAWNPAADTWDVTKFGDADKFPRYDSDNAEAVDSDLHSWLDGQTGPNYGGDVGVYDASVFAAADNYNVIDGLTSVELGTDEEGFPILDEPIAYVIGSESPGAPKKPLTVAYEPTGCGRVLYTTYHTTPETHVGLLPQERVLLYLVMEIGVCHAGPIIE